MIRWTTAMRGAAPGFVLLLAVSGCTSPDRSHPGWMTTGGMIEPRGFTPAVLLADGTVLVAGGDYSTELGDTAELFDPSSGAWSATGGIIDARHNHSATLLNDGMVLVVGGWGSAGAMASAQLYDTSSGSWTATGDMVEARGYHTATLLADGRVLVVGGSTHKGGTMGSAEVYDPSTGSWTATAPMEEVRYGHTATLLPEGTVLVVGGGKLDALASAELYEPDSAGWSPAGRMDQARSDHTATLLEDGTVLVAGGDPVRGDPSSLALATAELYNPGTGTWAAAPNMLEARSHHTATLLPDGTVLVAGGDSWGMDVNRGGLASAELYDPVGGVWAAAGNMGEARADHTATLLPDGTVLVAVGDDNGDTLTSAELYIPGSGT